MIAHIIMNLNLRPQKTYFRGLKMFPVSFFSFFPSFEEHHSDYCCSSHYITLVYWMNIIHVLKWALNTSLNVFLFHSHIWVDSFVWLICLVIKPAPSCFKSSASPLWSDISPCRGLEPHLECQKTLNHTEHDSQNQISALLTATYSILDFGNAITSRRTFIEHRRLLLRAINTHCNKSCIWNISVFKYSSIKVGAINVNNLGHNSK